MLSLEVEFDVDGFGSLFGGGEVALLLEAADAGDDAVGEAAQLGVVFLHLLVELATLRGDAVLGALQLLLQVEESLRGGELGVALDGDLDAVGHGLAEAVLSLLEGLDLLFGEVLGVDLDFLYTRAGLDDLGEHALLIVGGTLDGVDELRDEVHATFVDVLHLAPCLLHLLVVFDEAVVDTDTPDEEDGHEGHNADDDDS